MQLKETCPEISISDGAYVLKTDVGILAHPVGFGKTGICAAHLAVEKERLLQHSMPAGGIDEEEIVDDPLLTWVREWSDHELPFSRSLVDYACPYARVDDRQRAGH